MGKFFNGQVKNDKEKLIKYGLIGGGVLLIVIILILIFSGGGGPDPKLEVVEEMVIEVNTELPDKMDYFTKFENFDEDKISIDDDDVDITVVGSYTVTLIAEDLDEVDIPVEVVDTTPPTLTLKEIKIAYGEEYSIEDFVTSCTDNSNDPCNIEYYNEDIDSDGNTIYYGNYEENGTYTIKIVASDSEGNTTEAITTSLTIGDGTTTPITPTSCTYGNLEVASNLDYPVAVIVGDTTTNCAQNRDLWDSSSVQEPVNDFYEDDYERLKEQLNDDFLAKHYPEGAKIVAYPNYIAVLNKDLKGLVGYAIYVKVYLASANETGDVNTDANLKIAYYLRSDGTREYDINAFDLNK